MNYKYKKKPVVIEAFQMTGPRRVDNSLWPEWLHEAWNKSNDKMGALIVKNINAPASPLAIRTLEGVMNIGWGDYIIRGIKNELYPCKQDIFEATYEKVEE